MKRAWTLLFVLFLLSVPLLAEAARSDGTYNIQGDAFGTTYINPTPTPYTHTHSWGAWETVREATCTGSGLRRRYCQGCRETQEETIPKKDHNWGSWTTIRHATCTETGLREHVCQSCGARETQSLKKTAHKPGSWTVTKEATCQQTGTRQARCTVCGTTIREKTKKTDHKYGSWEITTPATDNSKGKRTSKCVYCGKKKTEEFYPEGTLAADLDNPAGEVKELQNLLDLIGLHEGKSSGKYDRATVSSVKKFQKQKGLRADGIAWPETRRALAGIGGGEAVSESTEKFYLHLNVEQTSEKKDSYAPGEQLTFQWTLTNAAKKSKAVNLRVFTFKTANLPKNNGTEIAQPGDLNAGESVSGTWVYTVSPGDLLTGKFVCGFVARGKIGKNSNRTNTVYFLNNAAQGKKKIIDEAPDDDGEDRDDGHGGDDDDKQAEVSPAMTSPPTWTPPEDYHLDIAKTIDGDPANKLYYVKGETIHFRVSIANPAAVAVKNVIATDSMFPDLAGNIGTLGKGEKKEFLLDYKVTAEDVSKGTVKNEAVVSYTGPDKKLKTAVASVDAAVGSSTSGLAVIKVPTSKPKNKLFYTPGETVDFNILVFNPTKRTMTGLKVFDWLYSKTIPIGTEASLAPGKLATFTFQTKVKDSQAQFGKVINVVRVRYLDPEKMRLRSTSAERSVPAGFPDQEGVSVVKTVISSPKNGHYYQEGEEVRYLIEVHNNTVQEIVFDVRDSLAKLDEYGYRTIASGEKLKPAETFSIHFAHIVTAADVKNTRVKNVASAAWATKRHEYLTISEPVYVPTAGRQRVRRPEPPAVEGTACEPVLTALGDGTENLQLRECETHAEIAEQGRLLTVIHAYDEAVSTWNAEISRLYASWIGKSDAEGALVAEDEQAAFRHQMEAFSSSLALVTDEQKAATTLSEEYLAKCVELCYELHRAPEKRPDSLDAAHTSLPAATPAEECERTATYGEASADFLCTSCETHAETGELVLEILAEASDDEDKALAWMRAQTLRLTDLNEMYDVWYLSAPEEQRSVIAADRMSFDELIAARRTSLADLYPDDAATAEETLYHLIDRRTAIICRVLHEAGILTE